SPLSSSFFPYTSLFRSNVLVIVYIMISPHFHTYSVVFISFALINLKTNHLYCTFHLLFTSYYKLICITHLILFVIVTSFFSYERSEEHTSELQSRFDLV